MSYIVEHQPQEGAYPWLVVDEELPHNVLAKCPDVGTAGSIAALMETNVFEDSDVVIDGRTIIVRHNKVSFT